MMKKFSATATNAAARPERETPRISSRDLLAGRREVIIEHEDAEYRLCLTGSNKLILVK